MGHSGGGAHRALRVPRALLQWAAAAFGARVSQSPGLRATVGSRSIGSLTLVSTKSGQVQRSTLPFQPLSSIMWKPSRDARPAASFLTRRAIARAPGRVKALY